MSSLTNEKGYILLVQDTFAAFCVNKWDAEVLAKEIFLQTHKAVEIKHGYVDHMEVSSS